MKDYRRAAVAAADRVMLQFVEKLTRRPASLSEEDIDALRACEFSERAILDVVLISAYYAFVNRLADGLGVEMESYWPGREDPVGKQSEEEGAVGPDPARESIPDR